MSYRSYTKEALSKYHTGLDLYLRSVERVYLAGSKVLHVGAGRDLNGMVNRYGGYEQVYGVDVDRAAISRYPGTGWHASAERLPFGDNSFELVVSEYVLEHLQNPAIVFQEVERVLVPGGSFVSLAPNFYSYKSLIAHFTPLSLHKIAVKFLRGDEGREGEDVYATEYKASTLPDIIKLADAQNLVVESIEWANNGPTWFQRLPLVFEAGRLLHLLLDFKCLERLRCNMVIVLKKKGPAIFFKKESSEVDIQCVDCNSSPMQSSGAGYCCGTCGREYPFDGSLYSAMS